MNQSGFVVSPPARVTVPVVGTADVYPVRRVYCVGRNYVEHAHEMGFTGKEPPFFFCKPADAVVPVPSGKTGKIQYPSATSDFHYEGELVVAIGSGGQQILAADAHKFIYGFALGLDMTRRDIQMSMRKQGRPWEAGKAFDQSAPLGPIHKVQDVGMMESGPFSLSVDGVVKQDSDFSKLIWNVPQILQHLSELFRLEPGDLIFTGTPAGVGAVVQGQSMRLRNPVLGELAVDVVGMD